MKEFESQYNKIYEDTLNHLKSDFEKEKSEWRSISPLFEYRGKAILRLTKMDDCHEDVKDIRPKAEMLFESRKSFTSIVQALLIIIEFKDDEYKKKIVEDIAKLKALGEFITYLDQYENSIQKNTKATELTLSKVSRTKDDNLTSLNQLQTAIFFKYLRELKVILGEDYLTNINLANVISISTGYSPNSTRQTLSTNTKDYKTIDLKIILEHFQSISRLIKRDLENNQ